MSSNATIRDWKKNYGENRYGEADPSKIVYINTIPGKVNGNNQDLCIALVPVGNGDAMVALFFPDYFISPESVVVFTLANGSRYEIPYQYTSTGNGMLGLGTNLSQFSKILNILNKGNFTIKIVEPPADEIYDVRRIGVFKVGNQTTGIFNLIGR